MYDTERMYTKGDERLPPLMSSAGRRCHEITEVVSPSWRGIKGIRVKLRNEKTDKLSLTVFAMIAPKGRNTTAQGSAPGLALLAKQALKGRHKV